MDQKVGSRVGDKKGEIRAKKSVGRATQKSGAGGGKKKRGGAKGPRMWQKKKWVVTKGKERCNAAERNTSDKGEGGQGAKGGDARRKKKKTSGQQVGTGQD